MVQCEMCGTEVGSPNRVKIEGAELDVCDECTDFGTEIRTQESSTTSTKYSTGSSSGTTSNSSSSSGSSSTSSGSTGGSGGSGRDMFDDLDELAQDYDEIILEAREQAGLSQEELANQLNEKASLIRKVEHGDMLPNDEVQRKLEGALDVDLSAGSGEADAEWEGGSSSGEYTLGDVVKRKD